MRRDRRVRVSGADLAYVDEGTGVPVVFSHGGASDVRYWEPQRAVFAEHHRFVGFSRRFHGAGSWPAETDTTSDVHASDLIEVVRQLDAGPVHIVGFSAQTALQAAVLEPSLVRSLTIVEPNVPSLLEEGPSGEDVLSSWRRETERVRSEASGDAQRHAELWFELVNNRGAGTFADQPPDFRAMWFENFGARRPPEAGEPLTCPRLGAIAAPTLAIGAEYGMPYSRAILERVASCIAGSEHVILPSTTHFMSYQSPGAFNRAVLDFVARH